MSRRSREAKKITLSAHARRRDDGPENVRGFDFSRDAGFQAVAVAHVIQVRLARFESRATPKGRVLVKDGAWTVPPIERPVGWETRADWQVIRDPW